MEKVNVKPGDKWCPMARLESDGRVANRWNGRSAEATENFSRCRCMTTACAVFVGNEETGTCGLIRGA